MVDNYDSFTYNLVHLFEELGAEVIVRRNDQIGVEEAEALARPEEFGACQELGGHHAGVRR